jgi:hypothetical protein
MNAVVTLTDTEIDMVSGGNALDTTTGTYVSYDRPADEPALDPMYTLGFPIRVGTLTFKTLMRLVTK